MSFTIQEENRLVEVCAVADAYMAERREKILAHAAKIKELEAQRLAAVSAPEKDRLTREIRDLSPFDPVKFNPPFEHSHAPYLAGIVIEDDDPRIGRKHLLFGKQGLMDSQSNAVIIDWRKAAISKLYYEYEEGEDYEEVIVKRERTGRIEKKIAYGISRRELQTIQTGTGTLVKQNGLWKEQGKTTTMDQKEASGDYRMVDIVSLISPAQFELITRQHEGCLYLTGGAGSGKTTVALHRLSYLMYNFPDSLRPERCLVVMFNRSLRDYVAQTSRELLTSRLAVETFHSWADGALRSLGVPFKFSVRAGRNLGPLKKKAGMYRALVEHAQTTDSGAENPIEDLAGFYANSPLLEQHLGKNREVRELVQAGKRLLQEGGDLAFDDAGILLHLIQLRGGEKPIPGVLNWYDHILVDEAQDLSLIELKCLEAANDPSHRSLTVCADERQKILDFVDARGFAHFQLHLNEQGVTSGQLSVSYRSTRQIMELASRVSGRTVENVLNKGPEPRFHAFQTLEEALARLKSSIAALLAREPHSLTAVICRYRKDAETVFGALRAIQGVRLQTSNMTFTPGVVVTNVHQVKGLEFSGVILWNPSGRSYPGTELGKNLLYVAVTRASNRLAIYHHDALSPLFQEPGKPRLKK